jgi:hypothetical protein
VELGVGADAVAMMSYEFTALRDFLYDRGHCRPLLRRHPMARASESDLGQLLVAHDVSEARILSARSLDLDAVV